MALINGTYVFVKEESLDRKMKMTEYPVESGINLTDHIRAEPDVLHLTGAIVGKDYQDRLFLLCHYMTQGVLVSYEGRYVMKHALIQNITTRYLNTVWGGCEFEMTVRAVRVVRNTFEQNEYSGVLCVKATREVGRQEVEEIHTSIMRFHQMRKGETLEFLAQEYGRFGVTVESIKQLNQEREDIFAGEQRGNWNALMPDVRLRLGVW